MDNGEQKTAWLAYSRAGLRRFEDAALLMRAQMRQADETVAVLGPGAGDDEAARVRELGFGTVVRRERDWSVGKALNEGLQATSAELVVVVSTEAVPLGPHFFSDVVRVFAAHPRVAAVRCTRIEDRTRLTRWALGELPVSSLHDVERAVLAGPNLHCFGIRRSAWAEAGFDESAETSIDKIWSYFAIQRGHAVSPSAAMFSDQSSTPWCEAFRYRRRQALEFYTHTGEHVCHARPSLAAAARAVFLSGPRIGARHAFNAVLNYIADVMANRRIRRSLRVRGPVQPRNGEAHV